MKALQAFFRDEHGAITVDFVVLTAAICLLGAIIVLTFSGEVTRLGNEISTFMEDQCTDLSCS